jgi:hypothetical protein
MWAKCFYINVPLKPRQRSLASDSRKVTHSQIFE